jgi:hypothetical protein
MSRPSGGVVILYSQRGSSSVPSVKKEAPGLLPRGRLDLRRAKEEAVHPPAPSMSARQWWEMELEAQAPYHRLLFVSNVFCTNSPSFVEIK